jgi:hypothetical protein
MPRRTDSRSRMIHATTFSDVVRESGATIFAVSMTGRHGLRRGVGGAVGGAGYSVGCPFPPRGERAAAAAGAGSGWWRLLTSLPAAATDGVIRGGHVVRALLADSGRRSRCVRR